MEDNRNVKWILIVSIVLLFVSLVYYPYTSLYIGVIPTSGRSLLDTIWLIYSRIVPLCFLATITVGALFTTNFSEKELAYKLTIRLFVLSMVLYFVEILRAIFTIT